MDGVPAMLIALQTAPAIAALVCFSPMFYWSYSQEATPHPEAPFHSFIDMAEAEPCAYVNPKQYNRILKRRQQRQRLDAAGRLLHIRPKQLGQQAWASERLRQPNGRFARLVGEQQRPDQDATLQGQEI